MALAPAAAAAGVLRVSHRAAIHSCRQARPRANVRSPGRARRRCRPASYRRTQHPAIAVAPAVGGSSYQNPLSGETPDPAPLSATAADYYLYSTGDLFPIQRSSDLLHWTPVGTAFATRPSWVVQGADWHPWSPSVIRADGLCPLATILGGLVRQLAGGLSCYVMYYVGLSAQFSTNCVAVATASSPAGPFVDQGPLTNGVLDNAGRPIGCGDNSGFGNIDPAPFLDTDGQAYLYVSTDRTCAAPAASCTEANSELQPAISVLHLTPDLLGVAGGRQRLFGGGQRWERGPGGMVVEGPWTERRGGAYHLFYSGGDWNRQYGMGDATLTSPLGPALKDPKNPILSGTNQVSSPGGGSTITGPRGGEWMLYHARLGGYNAPRQLFIDPVVWNADGSPSIKGPTSTPRSPAP